eukprot:TRINITY_DN48857_c0_g1_i1.p1 TRINITY_DN48857_c0_g1~~TRINITY_DN48857_c0_g1_i1.p1  ORF type:complete len:251 (+),score=37.91 TRINITY_DN48857_c0_g1_i1:83-835(+)
MTSLDELVFVALPSNNCARVMAFLALEGHSIVTKAPADFGGLQSEEFRRLSPQGKFPALVGPHGFSLYESQVILDYLVDKIGSPQHDLAGKTWLDAEGRAKMQLIIRVHDMYISSPNCSQPGFFGTQGIFYKTDMGVDERRKRVAEFKHQLTNLETLLHEVGPYALGARPSLADCVVFPTVHMLLHCLPALGWSEDEFFGSNAKLRRLYVALLTTPGFQETAASQTVWQSRVFTAERLGQIHTSFVGSSS